MADKKVNDMTYSELIVARNELKRKYMDIRFQKVIAHVDNPMQIRVMRRQIARLNTFIRQKEIAGLDK